MRIFLFFCLACLLGQASFAQTDSLLTLLEKDQDTTQALLPKRMMLTQSILWGKKGLLRITGLAPLTPEKRTRELKWRRNMLVTHQILGYATLGGMIAQGIVGQRLYKGEFGLLSAHKTIGLGVSISYFSTASLSLFAPPPMLKRAKEGNSSIKWHKRLAFLHMAGMITTIVLGEMSVGVDSRYKPYHRAAAFTTFGAFTASMVIMTF